MDKSSFVCQVKDLALSQQWLGLLLWCGFNPWPGDIRMPWMWSKKKKSLQTINAGEGTEKMKPFYTFGGKVNWYNHYEEQYGHSLKN